MFRFSSNTRLFIALTCALLLASRIAGTHLHLCFDGSEPPVSLHVVDTGDHHEDELAEVPHADRDVPLGGDYLSKKGGSLDLGFVVLAFALLLFILPRLRARLPLYLPPHRPRSARTYRLPPPRGPPRVI